MEIIEIEKKKIFSPEGDLMGQLCSLTKSNAKQWYKEYLAFHNDIDPGVSYLIGYFTEEKRNMLKKEFSI